MKYVLQGGGVVGRFEKGKSVRYKMGDLIELTKAEAAARGKNVRVASDIEINGLGRGRTPQEHAEAVVAEEQEAREQASHSFDHLSSLPWSKAKKEVVGLENALDLLAAREAESRGRGRDSVLNAITARLAELEG